MKYLLSEKLSFDKSLSPRFSFLFFILILFYLVLKGDTAKLQYITQEIVIHPGHEKNEFSGKGRVPIQSRLMTKMIWEQEVNSKKSEKQFNHCNKN